MLRMSGKGISGKAVTVILMASAAFFVTTCDVKVADDAAKFAFRDAAHPAPPGAKKVFKLSADYPESMPATCDGCDWLKIDVDFADQPAASLPRDWNKGNWGNYLDAILKYVREGQDANLADEVGFQANVGGKTRWFSVPWMAFNEVTGREYFHGATNERTLKLSDIAGPGSTQHSLPTTSASCAEKYPQGFESWSVGYYNAHGGYALGKAIPRKTGKPELSADGTTLNGLPFPEGTAVVKVLTTSATVECVSFLKGSPEWTIDRHKFDEKKGAYLSCEREPQTSRIVQVDVAVRDNRSPSGWVYGTYAYDGTRGKATFWENLLPLGLQWGSDPTVFPAVAEQKKPAPLQQSIPYPDIKIYQHGGCEGRLAGPADNPQSSCVSCHASAFSMKPGVIGAMGQNLPPSFGFKGLCTADSPQDNAYYFQTIKAPQPYPDPKYKGTISLDTSMQLGVAMNQYAQYATAGAPKKCVEK